VRFDDELRAVPVFAAGAGAASQQSLGTVVFGGMLASTLLAIPFLPVFFIAVRKLAGRSVEPAPGAAKRSQPQATQRTESPPI
jgi:hydrophobic/amphiphilic exporter-1 (mainly G- bacteria), HAE1 family